MHEYCEYGVASHWAYKQKSDLDKHSFIDTDRFKWIQDLVNLGKEPLSEEEYLQHVKLDLFQDQIFVMTPKGDAIRLLQGSTALDFAFRIHQDIGKHAVLAKVNGSPVKLSASLQNGDIVEIITDKKQKPHRDWLNMVKTGSAARAIRNNLRKQGVKLG
jgi:GTP pyrophosphokinase